MTTTAIDIRTHQPRLNYPKASPGALKAMLAFSNTSKASGLDPTLYSLVEIRASQINGCAFCLDMHIREARERGETEERLDLLAAWDEADVFTQRERAALAWTEAVTRIADGRVPDEVFGEAIEEFTEKELTDLTLAIVVINGWNRLNVAFHIPPRFQG